MWLVKTKTRAGREANKDRWRLFEMVALQSTRLPD